MSLSLLLDPKEAHNVVEVFVKGKLSKDDYERFAREVNGLIERRGRIRILFEMHDFHGWDREASREEFKSALGRFSDVDRIAVVGENKWQEWMAMFCRLSTKAQIRYFDRSERAEASAWIHQWRPQGTISDEPIPAK